MSKKTWKPSNEPTRYDQTRVAQVKLIEVEIKKLGLPLNRFRKLNGILNALIMQIEDGGDNPEVNQLLLDALRTGIRHQVDEHQAKVALSAIDIFDRAEAKRWEQVEAGTLPPIELTAKEQLDDLMQDGYELLRAKQLAAACDRWLEAWEMVKQMATPEMRTVMDFDAVYSSMLQSTDNWHSDLRMELNNAGIDDPIYHEHRVRYVNEFLTQFSNEDEDSYVRLRCAEGESLWELGRQDEAETVYRTLVEKLPDKAWGYIGWSDQYYWSRDRPVDYERAEAVLHQALAQPHLDDREYVLDRLVRLYEESEQSEKGTPYAVELDEIRARKKIPHLAPKSLQVPKRKKRRRKKRGR